ncbi:MAG: carboxypeptidase-like regulatory domain-containing protein [Lentimicrobiaceae bacterium]|jgi:hypothetical protein
MVLLYYLKTKKAQTRTDPSAFCDSTSLIHACILCAGFLLFLVNTLAAQESLLDKSITISKQRTTLYNALNLISEKADCLFIYDSQVVESDKRVKLVADNQPLKQVLDNILANPELTYKVIGQHILIYRVKKENLTVNHSPNVAPVHDTIKKSIIIKGHVFDNENKTAMPFVSIGILEENIGTITNMDGYFALKIPSSYSGSSMVVSHIGYMSQRIPIQLLNEQQVDIFLDRRIISLQEVIIRYLDPTTIVEKAMHQRKVNNSLEPVYITAFYREGVQKNSRYISYSEAVFKVYKSSYKLSENYDQVKLLKSRKIDNTNPRDTVLLKLKAGVLSALQLDIVKCVPGFLDLAPPIEYTYTYSDLVSYNSKDAYAITFEQNNGITDALFIGTLYVEKESFAILGADFEINPAFLDKAAENLILKKSPKLKVKLEKISYSISYSPLNGKYYPNHTRCDIQLKTRLRKHLSWDNFSTFLEFATCHIDTANVVKFSRQEVLKPNVVFSDAPYSNDNSFWGDYNIIAPEAKLSEALSKIIGKIEEIK